MHTAGGPAWARRTHPFPEQQGLFVLRPRYHWHLEVIPRLTRVAGFEWGTGFYINPVPPEQAAAFLHETDVDAAATPKR
jgi:galactose-1-phosphate uridylyltransferase